MAEDNKEKIERRWKKYQEFLGYTDEELAIFRSNPRNTKVIEDAKLYVTHELVVDIIEAHNCTAGYKAGDSFAIDSQGILIPDRCPPKICAAAVWALKPLIDRMWEAFCYGSTECFHSTVRCPDVGVRNGGAGEITMRIRAVPKQKAK